MSRSGYNDGCDQWSLIMWRGAVASAIRGKRGQAFLKEMLAALDALPEKKLIAHKLSNDGEVCAIGAVGTARGLDMSSMDSENADTVSAVFGISRAFACEIAWENDEIWCLETPERRFVRMRAWVERNIKSAEPA